MSIFIKLILLLSAVSAGTYYFYPEVFNSTTVDNEIFQGCPNGWEERSTGPNTACINNKPQPNYENVSFSNNMNVSSVKEARSLLLQNDSATFDSEIAHSSIKDLGELTQWDIQNGKLLMQSFISSFNMGGFINTESEIRKYIIVCNNGKGKLITYTTSPNINDSEKIRNDELLEIFSCDGTE